LNPRKIFSEATNMCDTAWEALKKTALMALACALCALALSIHGQNAGGLPPETLHIVLSLAEAPAGLFAIAAVGVCLLQSLD
jgi:hypothetical protein